MESEDEVRASLGVVPLADLSDHEETTPEGEAEVSRLLAEAGSLSWPLVIDADTGLILDGSHRAHVLRREYGARLALVQRVTLESAAVRIGAWCRVFGGVSAGQFEIVARRLGLRPVAEDGLACHYAGRVYGRPGLGPAAAHELARELESLLAGPGRSDRVRFVDEDAAVPDPGAPDTLVVRLPPLDKTTVRARMGVGRFPPKSTRFLLPFRVFGLPVPLRALAGPRSPLEAWVAARAGGALVRLGEGLAVDRRYPEPLWQFADYRIPRTLFARPADHAAYAAALRRATARAAATP